MVMQINRTPTPNNPPASGALAQGQLSVGMADTPNPTLWVGVPTTIDPTGRRLVNGPGALFSTTAAGTVPMTGAATAAAVLTAAGTWTVPAVYTTTVNGVVPAPTAAAPAAAMLTAAGTWALPQIRISTQVFTASGTYTPPTGLQFATVECVGGGGAGGRTEARAAGDWGSSSGGQGGSYSRSTLSAAQIGASQTVTIGAGGAATTTLSSPGDQTSFGTLVTAPGGQNGFLNTLPGGTDNRGTGDITSIGATAVFGTYNSGTNPPTTLSLWGGLGGGGLMGGGAPIQVFVFGAGGAPGNPAAANSGAGGGGAASNAGPSGSQPALAGGAGGSGICIVTEFSF